MKRLLAPAVAAVVIIIIAATTLRAPGPEHPPVWTDPASGIELRRVSAGRFRMGTPPAESGREPQEVLHEVTLTRPFYLGTYEVTQKQWAAVMGTNPSHFQSCTTCPVERVSFHDVEAFIARLNERSGPGFRLPTEAEWEYACRAGGVEPFGGSSSLSSRDANIDGAHPYNGPKGTARNKTTRVGHFAANTWGFFDMSGNVWEWTSDRHCPYTTGALAPALLGHLDAGHVTDPIGSCASDHRVIRGGSWKFGASSARCGLRYTHRPPDRGYSLGFRLAHD